MSIALKIRFTFIEEIKKVSHSPHFMVSFDVESLFTNIPLNETINIAVDLILENKPEIELTKKDLTELFEFATKYTHFSFNGNIFVG